MDNSPTPCIQRGRVLSSSPESTIATLAWQYATFKLDGHVGADCEEVAGFYWIKMEEAFGGKLITLEDSSAFRRGPGLEILGRIPANEQFDAWRLLNLVEAHYNGLVAAVLAGRLQTSAGLVRFADYEAWLADQADGPEALASGTEADQAPDADEPAAEGDEPDQGKAYFATEGEAVAAAMAKWSQFWRQTPEANRIDLTKPAILEDLAVTFGLTSSKAMSVYKATTPEWAINAFKSNGGAKGGTTSASRRRKLRR